MIQNQIEGRTYPAKHGIIQQNKDANQKYDNFIIIAQVSITQQIDSDNQLINKMRNKNIQTNPTQNKNLDVSVNTQNRSFAYGHNTRQIKQSYLQFISNFDKNIDYQNNSSTQIQNSLNEMRVVLKQFNFMLNKMMDKNYQYLADRQVNQTAPERQIQILKAQIQNAKKLIGNQDIQITTLNNITYSMQGKQSYEQKLIDQIIVVKDKMPSVHLESKHNACDINRNGYVLINQEQDNSLYFKVNLLRSDIQRAYERLRRFQDKQKLIAEKQRQLQQKNYQIEQKFSKCVETARQNSMEITVNGTIISLKQKYLNLQKKRDQQFKKNCLLEHVSKNNQTSIQKKIQDMKRLMTQYNIKQKQIQKKLEQVEKETESLLNKSNLTQKLAQKSFSFRYAQTLLKGQKMLDKQKGMQSKVDNQYQDDFQDFLNNRNQPKKGSKKINQQITSATKPGLNLIRRKNQLGQNKYQKSMSMVQIPLKQKKQKDSFFQDKQVQNKSKIFNIRRTSANEQIKNNINQIQNSNLKSPESPKLKVWKQQNKDDFVNQKLQKQYKISKPSLNIKRKAHNISAVQPRQQTKKSNAKLNSSHDIQQIEIQPKFSRITQKKNAKSTDQYMSYLQQKGRKILGLS